MAAAGRHTEELNGVLVTWNDGRGFGFIRPDGGGADVFVHIAAFGRGAERPKDRDRVAFVIGPGRGGRQMAARARLISPAGSGVAVWIKRLRLRRRERRIALAAGLGLLMLWAVLLGEAPPELLGPYLGMGLVAMALYRADKGFARNNSWRVSEATLHATDLIFGIIGGLLAQGLYGHKTAKPGFVAITGVIVVGHVALLLAVGSGVPRPQDLQHLGLLVEHLFDAVAPGP